MIVKSTIPITIFSKSSKLDYLNLIHKLRATTFHQTSSISSTQQSTSTTTIKTTSTTTNNSISMTISWLVSIFWKAVFLIKLASVMIFFELLRLSDTVVNVLLKPQIYDDDDDDDGDVDEVGNGRKGRRQKKKSPVDTGYIERNRGYK